MHYHYRKPFANERWCNGNTKNLNIKWIITNISVHHSLTSHTSSTFGSLLLHATCYKLHKKLKYLEATIFYNGFQHKISLPTKAGPTKPQIEKLSGPCFFHMQSPWTKKLETSMVSIWKNIEATHSLWSWIKFNHPCLRVGS